MTNSWPTVPLGEALQERREVPPLAALAGGEMRILAKIGFDDGRIRLRSDGETRTGMILVRPGDLVVSGINAAKGAIAIYGEESIEPIAATIHYGAYIPNKERVEIKYLWWLLRSATFRDLLLEHVPGGIKTELKAKRLLPIPVPLPPLSEQQRIVTRIEDLAAKIVEARSLRLRAATELEILIPRIAGEFFGGAKYQCERLDKLLREGSQNGLSPRPSDTPPGLPILRISAGTSRADGVVDERDYKYLEVTDKQLSLYKLERGDLLACRFNGNLQYVGRFSLFSGESGEPRLYPDKLIRFRVDLSRVIPEYVRSVMNSPYGRARIEEFCQTTAGNIGISAKNLNTIPVPVPPLEEQIRIVAYLDDLQAKVIALKRVHAETSAELDAMLPSVLDKAFSGNL